jgi:hypothetical protein
MGDVITNFWDWYRRRYAPERGLIADLALEKCEETFKRRAWDDFGYWYKIYRRERTKTPPALISAPEIPTPSADSDC